MAKSKKVGANGEAAALTQESVRDLELRLKEVKFARDSYLLAIRSLLPTREAPFTKAQLREMEQFHPSLAEMVEQLETECLTKS